MSQNTPSSLGQSRYELVTSEIPDITMYVSIGWYDWVFYRDNLSKEEMIGRNLGPCGCLVGAGDCYNILTEKATVVSTNTVLAIMDK